MQPRTQEKAIALAVLVPLALLVAVGLERTRRRDRSLESYGHQPARVMGTTCMLTAIVQRGEGPVAQQALLAAEAELRQTESIASIFLETSEISRLNAARANQIVPLSSPALEMLTLARGLAMQTDGAFDVTCRPMLRLWKEAAGRGCLPTQEEKLEARSASRWGHFQLLPGKGSKTLTSAEIDLGGVAKGFAIDRAVAALATSGCRGGMVNVGGDLRCFGAPADGAAFSVALRSPFDDTTWASLRVTDRAVCTSGNYARYVTISGKRYSHIVDPRTGVPADAAPSVTVVAISAAVADGWATALSVTGPPGLALLPQDATVDAMVVTGTPPNHTIHATPGFVKLLPPGEAIRDEVSPPPAPDERRGAGPCR